MNAISGGNDGHTPLPRTDDGDQAQVGRLLRCRCALVRYAQDPPPRGQGRLALRQIDPAGIVITNNHVIDGANEVQVIFNDGQKLKGVRISCAVRCVPPENKPSTKERDTCADFLDQEISLLSPNIKAILGIHFLPKRTRKYHTIGSRPTRHHRLVANRRRKIIVLSGSSYG